MIDTLKYTRELEAAGLDSNQAEKMVRAQIGMISDSVTTKADLLEFRVEMIERFSEIDSKFAEIGARFSEQDSKFDHLQIEMKAMEERLLKRLGGFILACTAFLGGIQGLIPYI